MTDVLVELGKKYIREGEARDERIFCLGIKKKE